MQKLGQLQDAIQRDLAWRKREISDIRSTILRNGDITAFVLRGGQVLLCGHWEGFLKKSTKLYIQHIFAQNLKLSQLTTNIISIAYFEDVMIASLAKYPGSEENHLKLARKIASTINKKLDVPRWNVDTEGNPGSDVLKRILNSIGIDEQLGLDNAIWATTKVFINEQLVRDRHQIAHGEGTRIDKVSLLERAERLLQLLDILNEQLMHAAQKKSYKVKRIYTVRT